MSKEAIEHYEAALKEAFPSGATGDVFHHWNEARKALAEQPAQQRHISYVCPQCHWSLEEQPAQQQEPVAGEPLTDSQIMASIGRHWGGEKTSISQSRPVGQQWEQICELVRCVIRERYTTPPAQRKPLTDKEIADIATSHPLTWVNLNTVEHRRCFARAIEAKLREKNNG